MMAGLLSLAAFRIASPAASKAEDDFQLVKVAEGVYAGIAKPGGLASGNAGFIIGDGGVLIVDTFFTPVAVEELIGEIGKANQSAHQVCSQHPLPSRSHRRQSSAYGPQRPNHRPR